MYIWEWSILLHSLATFKWPRNMSLISAARRHHTNIIKKTSTHPYHVTSRWRHRELERTRLSPLSPQCHHNCHYSATTVRRPGAAERNPSLRRRTKIRPTSSNRLTWTSPDAAASVVDGATSDTRRWLQACRTSRRWRPGRRYRGSGTSSCCNRVSSAADLQTAYQLVHLHYCLTAPIFTGNIV